METTQRIVKNFGALSISTVISKALRFVTVIYLARILGASGFGKINFALAIIAYFMMITNMGLNELGVREIARSKEKINNYVNLITTMRFSFAVVSILLLFGFLCLIDKPLAVKKLIFIFGLTLFPYALSPEWVFRGIEKMEYVAISRILSACSYVILLFVLIRNSTQLLQIGLIAALTDFIALLFLFFAYCRRYGSIKFDINIKEWFKLLGLSWPLFGSSALWLFYLNFGIILLGFIKSDEAVGLYSAAYRLVLVLYIGIDLVVTTVFPVISRYYKQSRERLQRFLSRLLKILIAFAIPVGVGGTLLAGPLMTFVYGPEYSSSVIGFQILIWFIAVSSISLVVGYSLVACDRQTKYMLIMAFAALIGIALNFILIPRIGFCGPAVALVASELTVLILSFISIQKIIKIPIVRFVSKPLFASAVMGIFLALFFKWNLFLLFFMGGAIYFTLLLAIKGISLNELSIISFKNQTS